MNTPSPLESIFFAALEKGSPQERAAYLDEACAGDINLRRRVEKMLTAQSEVQSFLELPAAAIDTTVSHPPAEGLGTLIGSYKLIELIGEGGMGTVWMAQQSVPVKRVVALKLIKAGMDSKQVIARFEAERQALALMDHANIARVLDAGTTSAGRPYFVMDLVKGVPITKYCDDHRLTTRQRLELFIPVCQAIQHAHQKGIIHRDLKPSNVLVAHYDGRPVPKVIDFGVAKAAGQSLTDRTLVTGFGAILGTPEYMSPEQAEINQLDIDTRSDIYSLGVLLYELLAGSPPFSKSDLEKAGMLEMLRVIREKEPSKPSTKLSSSDALPTLSANRGTEPAKLTKLVRGELDWIVMKALEKDRNRRYETANGFAADIQRYLADESVQACPPSAVYRLRKFVRRNKAPVLAAVLVLLVLVAGVVGTGLSLVRAVAAERTARTAEDHERQAKLEAERNLEQALKAAETFFTRVSESKLLDKPALQPFRKELLEEAQKHYLELFNKEPNNAKLRAELAASYLRMVIVLYGLEQGAEAVQALEKALDLVEPLVRANPGDRELARRLANVCKAERPMYRGWADGFARPEMAGSRVPLERACAIWKQLAEEHPDMAEMHGDYATFLMYLGDCYFSANRHADCGRLYGEADQIFTRIAGVPSLSCEHRINAAFARLGVGWMLDWRGRSQEGLDRACESQGMIEQLMREFPDKPILQLVLLGIQCDMAAYYAQLSRHAEAEGLIQRALERSAKLQAAEPDVPSHSHPLVHFYTERAKLRENSNRMAEAEADFRKANEVAEATANRFPQDLHGRDLYFHHACEFARFLWMRNRRGEAQLQLQRLEKHLETAVADSSGTRADTALIARARLRMALGQPDKALEDIEKAIRLAPDAGMAPWWHLERSFAHAALKQEDKALADLTGAIERWPNLWDTWTWRGNFYRDRNRWHDALADYSRAVDLNPQRWDTWHQRGLAHSGLKEWARAAADQSKAIELNRTHWGSWHQRGLCNGQLKQWDAALADFMKVVELEPNQALGVVQHLQSAMRSEEAEKLLRQRIGVLEKAVPDAANLQGLGQCYRLMAQLLEKSDRQQDREAYLNRAIDAFAKLAKEQPATANHRDLLARSQFERGVHQRQSGQTDAAELDLRQAMELWTKLAAEVPSEPAYLLHAVNTCLYSLAPLLQENGRALVAEQLLAGAMPTWAKLARKNLKDHDNVLADATGLWARLLFDLGKSPQAEQLANKVVEQWPENARALIARGRIRMALKEPEKALEDFEKAIRLDPTDGMAPWWHLDRSYAYAALKQEDKALAVLTGAIERWPNLWDTWMWRGNFYHDRNRWRDAVADYSKAVTLKPHQWTCWQARGTTFVRLADWDCAVADYEKAMALQPRNAGLHHELAWLLAHCPEEKVRNPKRAVELARLAVGSNVKNGVYRGALGSALYRAGDWKAAIEELNESIKLRGRHGADMLFLAMAHKRLEQDAEARTWFDRAIEWIEMNAPKDDELRRFREEATVLLELKD